MMTEKDNKLMDQWIDEIQPLNKEAKYDEVLSITLSYWNNVDEPKLANSFSYHLLKSMVSTNFKKKDYPEALNWCLLYDKFDFEAVGRIDSGEKDFYIGKVYYECGDQVKAFDYFSVANKKSNGRCFQLPDGVEYKKIFNNTKQAK